MEGHGESRDFDFANQVRLACQDLDFEVGLWSHSFLWTSMVYLCEHCNRANKHKQ